MPSPQDADTRKFIDIEEINSKRTHTLRFSSTQIAKFRLHSNIRDMQCKNKTGYAYVIVDERFGRKRYSVNVESYFRTCYRSKHFPNALSAAEHALAKIKQIVASFDRKYNNAIHEYEAKGVVANPARDSRRGRLQRAAATTANAKFSNYGEEDEDDDDEETNEVPLPAKQSIESSPLEQQVTLNASLPVEDTVEDARAAAHALVILQNIQCSSGVKDAPMAAALNDGPPSTPSIGDLPMSVVDLPSRIDLNSDGCSQQLKGSDVFCFQPGWRPNGCVEGRGKNKDAVNSRYYFYKCDKCGDQWNQIPPHLLAPGQDPRIQSSKRRQSDDDDTRCGGYFCRRCGLKKNKKIAKDLGLAACQCPSQPRKKRCLEAGEAHGDDADEEGGEEAIKSLGPLQQVPVPARPIAQQTPLPQPASAADAMASAALAASRALSLVINMRSSTGP